MKVIDLYKLVSDGKAPKKIKYNGKTYEKNIEQDDYETFIINHFEYLMDDINTFEQLNDEIEIIEEPKKIEKIYGEFSVVDYKNGIGTKWSNNEMLLIDKLNEIIDYINKGDSNE